MWNSWHCVPCWWECEMPVIVEDDTWFLKKLNTESLHDSSNPTSRCRPRRIKSVDSNGGLCTHVQSSITHNSRKVETTHRQMNGEVTCGLDIRWHVTQPYKGQTFSHVLPCGCRGREAGHGECCVAGMELRVGVMKSSGSR